MSPVYHLGPAVGGDGLELLLDNAHRIGLESCPLDLASVGIGVEVVISYRESFGQPKLSGHPRGYVPLVAGRSLRKGGRSGTTVGRAKCAAGSPSTETWPLSGMWEATLAINSR